MKKTCPVCGETFPPKRSWQIYCKKEKCQKKANSLRVLKCREKHNLLKIKTLEEMMTKEPYKTNYCKIITALTKLHKPPFEVEAEKTDTKTRAAYLKRHKKQWEIKTKHLLKATGLSSDTLSRYLPVLRKLGVINEDFSLSDRHYFEALKLRGTDVILNTDMNCIIFHPSTGYSFTYYTPRIESEYLKYSVKNLNEKVKELEEHLRKADNIWISIIANARRIYARELWDTKVLHNNKINVLTKLDFGLDWIFRINRMFLLVTFLSPEKLEKIIIETFNEYLKKKYPALKPAAIEKIHKNIQKEYGLNEDFFENLSKELYAFFNPSIFEHMITVELSGAGQYRSEELEKLNIIQSITLDREKPFAPQLKELEKLSAKKYIYDELEEKDDFKTNRTNNAKKREYVKPPFFEKFFQGYEQELISLGLKKEKLNEFYRVLDETATIIQLPILPDNIELLKKFLI
jgi:DNA-binding transcriptional ArsR family regulator